MDREQKARSNHRRGYSCASSVYTAFSDVNPKLGQPPIPRSDGGRCGAVLAALKTLREMGIDRTDQFEEDFTARFGSVKCRDLMRTGKDCNDCVGAAAEIVESLIGKENA